MSIPHSPIYTYDASLVRVVDADTLELEIDLGFTVRMTLPVRVRGMDSPEYQTAAGKEARKFALAVLAHRPLLIQTYRASQEWAADVWIVGKGVGQTTKFSDVMINHGHAEPFPLVRSGNGSKAQPQLA